MAYLIIEYSGKRELYPIRKELISIGNLQECDLVLADENAANIHCHINREDDGGYRLLSLAHYTMLKGRGARKERLQDGDVIMVGNTTLTFKEGEPSEDELRPPGEEESQGISLKPETQEQKDLFSKCQSCGKIFRGEGTLCPSCRELPSEKEAPPQKEGLWSVLGEGTETLTGLAFEQLLQMVKLGEIGRYTTVKGPTTDYQWKYASETPRLCRYLNICYNCGARVETRQTFCHICGGDLDGLGRKRAVAEEEVQVERKRNYRRAFCIILIVLAAACFIASVFTSGLWRHAAPEAAEDYIDRFKERLKIKMKSLIGPEKFAAEREKIEQAGQLEEDKKFKRAREIYEEIIGTYPGSALADEARQGLERIQNTRETMAVKSMMGVADSLFNLGKFKDALRKYQEIKRKYPDHPLAREVDEKIEKTKFMMER